jgi:hypothetical protein
MSSKKKSTKKTTTRRASKKAATKRLPRLSLADDAKIKVIGEHSRRPDSRYGKGYALMPKCRTVGQFRAKRPDDANELLRAARNEKFIAVS